MIPVEAQPEPEAFELQVRNPGRRWLEQRGWFSPQPLPVKAPAMPPHWRRCMNDLHRCYRGICAYLCVYIERVIGGATVDHFVAKSPRPDLAHEWNNYRLACSAMNSRKRDYDDVLDPFGIGPDWFRLELVSGSIYPNPNLDADCQLQVASTISRLGLDDAGNRELRARHLQECLEGLYTADFLRRRSPFVYQEAIRQGLLP